MIYLIITTSIINKHGIKDFEHRKQRYIESIETALKLINKNIIKPIIVENNGERETYLDNLNCDIVYTNNNTINTHHKGVNELLDIQHVINKYNISDEDYIIKLTGRYKLLDNTFINILLENIYNFEAFIKFFNVATRKFHQNLDDCVLVLFAIKCKYIKKFMYDCKLSPECEFAIMVKNTININKIYQINNLELECCFANDFVKLIV
jgi:hypothetical protein